MKNIVVFASGSGSNFQSIIDAISKGELEANIVGFISNKESALAVQRAKQNNIPIYILAPSDFDNEKDYSSLILEKLKAWNAQILILAGYLKKIPEDIISAFENNILNIHPSLLPKYGGKGFYGKKVHEAVIENKETKTGCTVHIVTKDYDKGPVIGQSIVKVLPSDSPESIAKKVLQKEHQLFPLVIKKYLQTLN